MNNDIANAIRSFVANGPSPTITSLLNRDAPKYEWTGALVELLVGQTLILHYNPETSTMELLSSDGNSVLRIENNENGTAEARGLMKEDLKALLLAIRIHEVESYDLVMLPPDMREANLESLYKSAGVTPAQMRRFTSLWTSVK